ncbi:ATP-binding protein [Streptomyces goshikiensis]|uniref:ATP-binding protein n=1 Tax=Streptomyces goshikiensis TaxID=1942 RepID=UPI00365DEC23
MTRKENLCICGPSRTGKSHLTAALGQVAIEASMTVAWFTIEDLGALVRHHRADDSLAMARLIRTDLIIVDDIGLLPVSPNAAEGLHRLVDAAYEQRALAVSSNLHPSKAHMFRRTCARQRLNSTGFGGNSDPA